MTGKKWFVLALALATVAAIVALVVVGWGQLRTYVDNRDADNAGSEAVEAASDQVVAMLGYDYETAESTLPESADGLTGDFRDEYLKLVEASIIPGAKEKNLTVRVSVQGAAVIEESKDSVDLLMFVNQVTTSKDNPQAVTSGSRLLVTTERVDDRWLVSSLEPI